MQTATNNLPKLLIVDEQANNVQQLSQIFSDDYQVSAATSGRQALDFCLTQQPDLILLDVMTSDIDSQTVCRQLKDNVLTQNIPVIFISTHNDPDQEAACLALGAVDFIVRPFNTAVIKARVRTHILLKQTFGLEKELGRQLVNVLSNAEQTNRELASLLKYTEAILLNSPLAMGVYAETGECINANEAYGQLVGSTREGVMAQNFRQIRTWKTTGLLDTVLTALASDEIQCCEVQTTTTFGKAIWVECQILPVVLNEQKHLLIQFSDLTAHKRLEHELRHHAFHDALTQLPNRRLLIDRLKKALHAAKRHKKSLAVLFLDLNRFKQLNDTHGHDVGDLLLIEVAERLLGQVRETDTVSRLGGDEFVVLLEDLDENLEIANENVARITEKIQDALNEPYIFGEVTHHGSASIGVKLVEKDEHNPEEILKAADAAMYAVKKARPTSR